MGFVESGKQLLKSRSVKTQTSNAETTSLRTTSDRITRMKDIGGAVWISGIFASSEVLIFTNPIHSPTFAIGEGAAMTIGIVATCAKIYLISEKEKSENIYRVSNDSLGYEADRYVYEGAGSTSGTVHLTKGDNFYYINLPELLVDDRKQPTIQQVSLMRKAYTQALSEVRSTITENGIAEGCSAIVIDAGTPEVSNALFPSTTAQNTREDIFSNKQYTDIHDKDRLCAVLSPEAFAALPLDQEPENKLKVQFDLIMDALKTDEEKKGDKIEKYVRALMEELDASDMQIREYLAQTFSNEAQNYNEPIRVFLSGRYLLSGPFIYRAHSRIELQPTDITRAMEIAPPDGGATIQLAPTKTGQSLFKLYDNGMREMVPVDLNQPLEEVIASETSDKRIKLVYALWDLLKHHTIDEILHGEGIQNGKDAAKEDAKDTLTTPKQTSEEKPLQQQLQEAGITINSIFENDTRTWREKRRQINQKKSRKPYTRRLMVKGGNALARGIITGLAIAGAIAPLAVATEPVPGNSPTQQSQTFIGSGDIAAGKVGFIEQDTTSRTIWDIAYHHFTPAGFYVTDISHEFSDNTWQHTSADQMTAIHLPELPDSGKYTELTGIASVTDNRVFNLPEALLTRVDSLRVTDTNGKEVPIIEFRNTDGLVTFVVPRNTTGNVLVQETLVSSDDITTIPHATEPIPKIDVNKLSAQAKQLLARGNFGTLLDSFAGETYSIQPPNAALLEKTDGTAESFINAAVRLSEKDCAIANTELALASSLYPHVNSDFINIALGFIAPEYKSKPTVSQLDSLHAHELTITSDGNEIDVTPSKPGNDKTTQNYLQALATDETTGASIANQWQSLVTKEQQEHKRIEQLEAFEALVGTVLLGGVALGGITAAKVLGPYVTEENIRKVREDIGLTLGDINESDLSLAYDVLPWLSHGNPNGPHAIPQELTVFDNKHEGLSKIRTNTTRAGLRKYRRHPRRYARKLGLSSDARDRLRTIARLVK